MGAKLFTKKDIPSKLFINNEWVAGTGPLITLTNPGNETDLDSDLHEASAADVDIAVDFAEKAFKTGEWSKFSGAQRGQCLNKLADLMEEHEEEIGYFESVASGRVISACVRDVSLSAAVMRYYGGWADKIRGDAYPPDDGFYKIVQQEPLGVCAGITAWNGSLHFLAWKGGPALACGNTSIIKPSEKSPLGTLACAYLIEAAGFPPGALQILPGAGTTGHVLSSHMKIAKVSFTGSIGTGLKVQDAATKSNLKRVTLELGGKSPAIVFDDADMKKAIEWGVLGITMITGQVCAASSRVYVHENIIDEYLTKLKAAFEAIGKKLGEDPQDPNSSYGPVIDKLQYDRIWGFIQAAKDSGVELWTGGEEYPKKGHYIAPTIFRNPADDEAIYKQEIFGPVFCAKSFNTEEEVLEMANNTTYGLAGAIFTQDINRALRVSKKIEAGTVCINCASMVGPQVPFGGNKMSGLGRELGEYAIRHYTEPKTIWVNLN